MASIAPEMSGFSASNLPPAQPPSRFWTYTEGRAMFELAAFYADAVGAAARRWSFGVGAARFHGDQYFDCADAPPAQRAGI